MTASTLSLSARVDLAAIRRWNRYSGRSCDEYVELIRVREVTA